jgi:predicted phosphodiesterase
MRLGLVSDIHGDPVALELAWAHLITMKVDRIVCAGDLVGYGPFPDRVVAFLQERQIPSVRGNHDRWGDDFWRTDLGIDFQPIEARFRFGGREVLAIHGDGLTERHWSARLLHRVTRHPATERIFAALHPSLGFRLVDAMNHRLGNTVTDPAALASASQRQQAWAEARLAAEPTLGLVVMGHTHRPALSEPSPGRWYVNPGAWFDGGRYAICSEGGVELRQFMGAGSGEWGAGATP